MHLADGRELPAKIVLRDEDLDLAFVRPTDALSAPLTSIDATDSTPSVLDPVMLVQRTNEATGWETAASIGNVQLVINKPRTYYQVAIPTLGGSGLGAPVFDLSGHFVGIVVLRNTGSRGTAAPGVLPSADVRDVAKQAPSIK
jgi:S1-C subfamily serine protease